MTDERKQEIYKASASGMTTAEIAQAEGLPEEDIAVLISHGVVEIEAHRAWMREMGWTED